MAKSHSSKRVNLRKSISTRTRFEVFKRDKDILNLITACEECNAGKSDKTLDDSSVLAKQSEQLEQLSSRRDQLEMMLKWRDGLKDIERDAANEVADRWNTAVRNYILNDSGMIALRKMLKKYGVQAVLEAIDKATANLPGSGKTPIEDVNKAWDSVGRICEVNHRASGNRDIARLYYIRGIVRNRCAYCNERAAFTLLRDAYDSGVAIEELEDIARSSRTWTSWQADMLYCERRANETRNT